MSQPTDDTIVVRLKPASLDDLPLGVMRIDLADKAVYFNAAARAMAGAAFETGSVVDALDFDPESRARLAAERDERRATECGSTYPMKLRRDGTLVELQVAAVPEYDAQGRMLGSAAFLLDTTMAAVNRRIHVAIGKVRHWRALLKMLDRTLREVIAFDGLMITLVADDRKSLRLILLVPTQ